MWKLLCCFLEGLLDTAKAQRARELLPAGRAVRRSHERDQGVDKVVWGTDGRHQDAGDSVAEDETGALSHGSLNSDSGVASLPRT